MIFRRAVLSFLFMLGTAQAFAAKATPPAGVYKGYIVIDAATGQTLAEEHADEVSPPASMTKLMTFAVLDDKIKSGALTLQTPVTATAADSHIGGTRVWLAEKEVFSVEELNYAMMIQSANDAAHALAHAAAGSVEAFVELMNAKAKELGMIHTTFRTPHGLPPVGRNIADGDLTTPRDFALLCRYLLLKTDVLKYTAVKERKFRADSPAHTVDMINHDHLLGVPGVDGLKTGYTDKAGYCLSSTAERNGRRVIVVIMGAFGPGGQVDLGKARDRKAAELIEKGFAAMPATSMFVGANSPVVPAGKADPSSPVVPAPPAPAASGDRTPSVIFTLPPTSGTKT